MTELILSLVPFVEVAGAISLFLGISSMLVGMLIAAFTGRHDRGRFF